MPCVLLIPPSALFDIIPIAMTQEMSYYYLDWKAPNNWSGTIATKYKNFTSPQDLRNHRFAFPQLQDGGYHFSAMGGIERVMRKKMSVVEGYYLDNLLKDTGIDEKTYIEMSMKTGKDLLNRSQYDLYPRNIEDIKLPYTKELITKYPYLVRNKK